MTLPIPSAALDDRLGFVGTSGSGKMQAAIIAILRRYRVQGHWVATKEAGAARYAIFGPAGMIGEPTGHREAQTERERLIAADVVALIGGRHAE